eukprot:499301_1
MPRTKKTSKKTLSKNKKEVSPELSSQSPSPSPKSTKKTKKVIKKRGKKDNLVVVKDISSIKSRCSKKLNELIGVSMGVEQETLQDGSERVAGVIGIGKHSVEVHCYEDLDSNFRILKNEYAVKMQYENKDVKLIKNEKYNRGSITFKINKPNIMSLTPTELKKQKDLDLNVEIIDIKTFKNLENGETGNLIVHVNNVSEVSYGSDDGTCSTTKIDIGDISDAISFLTDNKDIEKEQIIGLFNGFKTTRNDYTNIVAPCIVKGSILEKYFGAEMKKLTQNIDKICSLKPVFNADDFIECTIRKLKQKQEEVKNKKKKLKEVYEKLKIEVSIKQITNANSCVYPSLKTDLKKLNEEDMESIDDNDIVLRWKVQMQFQEQQSKHTLTVTVFDNTMVDAFELSANDFDEMDDDEKDDWLESLEETQCEIYISNSYETREWKKKNNYVVETKH